MIATRSHAFHHPAINVTRTAIIIQINGHIYGMKFNNHAITPSVPIFGICTLNIHAARLNKNATISHT